MMRAERGDRTDAKSNAEAVTGTGDERETLRVELEHRTLESWAVSPFHARMFSDVDDEEQDDGVVIKREIPIEKAIIASYPGMLTAAEDEIVVAHDESDTYGPEQVLDADELRNGADAKELIKRAQAFAESDIENARDDYQQTESEKLSKADVEITTEELPPINWLRETDTGAGDERDRMKNVACKNRTDNERRLQFERGCEENPDTDDNSGKCHDCLSIDCLSIGLRAMRQSGRNFCGVASGIIDGCREWQVDQ